MGFQFFVIFHNQFTTVMFLISMQQVMFNININMPILYNSYYFLAYPQSTTHVLCFMCDLQTT